MRKNGPIAFMAICIIAVGMVLLGYGAGYFTYSRYTFSAPIETLIIGGPALEQSAFIYIAAERGFFGRNGLNVEVRDN
jgi:ABC-type nitrate/sulfonate/bicarbonate transport system substrate-binding protein